MGKGGKLPTLEVACTVVVTKEDKHFSSWCPDLDIASCGDSAQAAVENLGDALELYLNTLEGEGELKQVFQERGIKLIPSDEAIIPSAFITQLRQRLPTPPTTKAESSILVKP